MSVNSNFSEWKGHNSLFYNEVEWTWQTFLIQKII